MFLLGIKPMENKHKTPTNKKNRNIYSLKLLKQLNEEYRKKPILSSFTKYDKESQIEQARNRLKYLSTLIKLEGKKVLEIGCGGGYVSYVLSKEYKCEVIGTDIYRSENWRTLNDPRLKYKVVNLAKENPFQKESFDLIISYVAWEHMRHPFEVLKQATEILKKSTGQMYIYANLYRSAVASHLYRHIFFPFPHLLFPDETLLPFAKKQGVEQWWIDAFFYVNKLTYSEYKEYFRILGLKMMHEKKITRPLDKELYERFEDKLGLYPISDLELDFFEVLLRRGSAEIKLIKRLSMSEILIEKKGKYEVGDKIGITVVGEGEGPLEYAWYVFVDDKRIETIWYSEKTTISYSLMRLGKYKFQAFIRDKTGQKISNQSEEFLVN